MNTQEHLTAIRAKCVELLATAKLRTPGIWDNEKGPYVYSHIPGGRPNGEYILQVHCSNGAGLPLGRDQNTRNAAFLASCAGPAEAGWTATIAAIDGLEEMDNRSHIYRYISTNIIAAWPEELLK